MPDNNYYSEVMEPENTSLMRVPEFAPIVLSERNSRFGNKLERRVELEAAKEHAKARLTAELVMTTTALSGLADQAIRAVPSAEAPVRQIVRTYAESSARRIAEKW
jgi:hypothetical protein